MDSANNRQRPADPSSVASAGHLEPRHLLQPLGLSLGQAMFLFASVVGLVSGVAAFAFYWLIGSATRGSLLLESLFPAPWGALAVVLSPAAGGLACAAILVFFSPEARGGVSEVIYALLSRGGRIPLRVGVFKAIASAICIGSGGSAGRESPVVSIGAAVGSSLADAFRVSRSRSQLLVACGAAAGIAAVFNAPIAGAFFSAEILTGSFEMRDLSFLFTASAAGAIVARLLLQDRMLFPVPAYHLLAVQALPFHVLLGVACALMGHAFISVLHGLEHWFARQKVPEIWKPAIGGLAVGLIGLHSHQVYGAGGDVMQSIMATGGPVRLLALLAVAKLIATAFTLGSGGSGGDMMPSLFIGAATGGALGGVVHHVFPHTTMAPGAYALVGSVALFAGVAHAPLTAIILGLEVARDYGIVLPVIFACATSALVASRLHESSIYTVKLHDRGIDVRRLRQPAEDLLDTIRVADVMTRTFQSVLPDLPLSRLLDRFASSGHHGFVVTAGDNQLLGIVTLSDAQRVLQAGIRSQKDAAGELPVAGMMTRDVVTCYPNQSLREALRSLGTKEVGRVPVVDPDDPQRVIGLLRRGDILRGYGRALQALPAATSPSAAPTRGGGGLPAGLARREFLVPSGAPMAGQVVRDLCVPDGVVLAALRRGGTGLAPSGRTRLQPGDRVTAFVAEGSLPVFRDWLEANGGGSWE